MIQKLFHSFKAMEFVVTILVQKCCSESAVQLIKVSVNSTVSIVKGARFGSHLVACRILPYAFCMWHKGFQELTT